MTAEEPRKAPPTVAKLLAVVAFFFILFFVAGLVGLPVPTGLVFVFFVTIVAPTALVMALISAAILRAVSRARGRPGAWPFFDVALQTFILAALLMTGIFVARFPDWLRGSYPTVRNEIAPYLSDDHTEGQERDFMTALQDFWQWYVDFLLEEGAPPTEVQQQAVRDAMNAFAEALAAECADCPAELTVEETARLAGLMRGVTRSRAPADLVDTADTAPSTATDSTAPVTGASR